MTLHRVRKSDFATIDLYGGRSGKELLIPAFTDESGEIGKLRTCCSNEWKVRVVRRFVASRYPTRTQFNVWIGFTTDEMRRVFQEAGKWEPRFPLIERRMTRGDCIELVRRMGWPTPPRSGCWMCPNRLHAEWMHLKKNRPGDWQKAISFEQELQQADEAIWLTRTGRPLAELRDEPEQPDLFTGRCDSGFCFT